MAMMSVERSKSEDLQLKNKNKASTSEIRNEVNSDPPTLKKKPKKSKIPVLMRSSCKRLFDDEKSYSQNGFSSLKTMVSGQSNQAQDLQLSEKMRDEKPSKIPILIRRKIMKCKPELIFQSCQQGFKDGRSLSQIDFRHAKLLNKSAQSIECGFYGKSNKNNPTAVESEWTYGIQDEEKKKLFMIALNDYRAERVKLDSINQQRDLQFQKIVKKENQLKCYQEAYLNEVNRNTSFKEELETINVDVGKFEIESIALKSEVDTLKAIVQDLELKAEEKKEEYIKLTSESQGILKEYQATKASAESLEKEISENEFEPIALVLEIEHLKHEILSQSAYAQDLQNINLQELSERKEELTELINGVTEMNDTLKVIDEQVKYRLTKFRNDVKSLTSENLKLERILEMCTKAPCNNLDLIFFGAVTSFLYLFPGFFCFAT